MLNALIYSCLCVVAQNPKLADVLRQLCDPSVTAIDASGSGLDDADVAALATALAGNTALTQLFLHENQIGDAGASALATALAGNTTLTELILENNEIGNTGATALAMALAGNTALTQLDLKGNQIGDAGATALATALAGNTSLTELDLGSNLPSRWWRSSITPAGRTWKDLVRWKRWPGRRGKSSRGCGTVGSR